MAPAWRPHASRGPPLEPLPIYDPGQARRHLAQPANVSVTGPLPRDPGRPGCQGLSEAGGRHGDLESDLVGRLEEVPGGPESGIQRQDRLALADRSGSGPAPRSRASQDSVAAPGPVSGNRSLTFDALGVKVREDRGGIVRLLELAVAQLIVDTPERIPVVVRRRVQSLDTSEFGDLTLDQPVVVSVLKRAGDHIPESKVDIDLVGRQRAQIVSPVRALERTHPYRRDPDLPE